MNKTIGCPMKEALKNLYGAIHANTRDNILELSSVSHEIEDVMNALKHDRATEKADEMVTALHNVTVGLLNWVDDDEDSCSSDHDAIAVAQGLLQYIDGGKIIERKDLEEDGPHISVQDIMTHFYQEVQLPLMLDRTAMRPEMTPKSLGIPQVVSHNVIEYWGSSDVYGLIFEQEHELRAMYDNIQEMSFSCMARVIKRLIVGVPAGEINIVPTLPITAQTMMVHYEEELEDETISSKFTPDISPESLGIEIGVTSCVNGFWAEIFPIHINQLDDRIFHTLTFSAMAEKLTGIINEHV